MAKGSGTTRSVRAGELPPGTHFHKFDVDGIRQGMINLAGRMIVMVNVDGVDIPFYLSTGKGGKYNVESGKWYPFFGMDPDGWFNKGSQEAINNYYGSPRLKAVAEALDKKFGDIRGDAKRKVVAKEYKENPTQFENIRRQINKDVKPAAEWNKGGERANYAELRVFMGDKGDNLFKERIEKIVKKIRRR